MAALRLAIVAVLVCGIAGETCVDTLGQGAVCVLPSQCAGGPNLIPLGFVSGLCDTAEVRCCSGMLLTAAANDADLINNPWQATAFDMLQGDVHTSSIYNDFSCYYRNATPDGAYCGSEMQLRDAVADYAGLQHQDTALNYLQQHLLADTTLHGAWFSFVRMYRAGDQTSCDASSAHRTQSFSGSTWSSLAIELLVKGNLHMKRGPAGSPITFDLANKAENGYRATAVEVTPTLTEGGNLTYRIADFIIPVAPAYITDGSQHEDGGDFVEKAPQVVENPLEVEHDSGATWVVLGLITAGMVAALVAIALAIVRRQRLQRVMNPELYTQMKDDAREPESARPDFTDFSPSSVPPAGKFSTDMLVGSDF